MEQRTEEDTMSELSLRFTDEALNRFKMEKIQSKLEDTALMDIAAKYAETFLTSPDVLEKYTLKETLAEQAVLHCYHAGIVIALYELTEEDYVPSEKTFAVLTNMDSIFFAELMFARWNVKKRYANYKTDFMAQSLARVLKTLCVELSMDYDAPETLKEVCTLLVAAGAATDIAALEDPYADLNGLA